MPQEHLRLRSAASPQATLKRLRKQARHPLSNRTFEDVFVIHDLQVAEIKRLRMMLEKLGVKPAAFAPGKARCARCRCTYRAHHWLIYMGPRQKPLKLFGPCTNGPSECPEYLPGRSDG